MTERQVRFFVYGIIIAQVTVPLLIGIAKGVAERLTP